MNKPRTVVVNSDGIRSPSDVASSTPLRPCVDFGTPLTLTTKKERRLRESLNPSRTPQVPRVAPNRSIASAPQLRRPLRKSIDDTPQEITKEGTTAALRSPIYNHRNKQQRTYLQQCFLFKNIIGTGSFGEVFACKCRHTGKDYAIKVSINLVRGEFKHKEALSHMKIPAHPNLLEFVCAWEQHEKLFIQTELCHQSLQKYCFDRNIEDDEAWGYFVDLARAIHHLHKNNMVHGDIKQENIFLTKDLRCKLGDFGLTFDLSNPRQVKDADEGDSRYLAAEVLNNQPTKEADMFSFGITMFETRTDADLPKDGEIWHQVRDGGITADFLDTHKAGGDLKNIIMALVSRDPKKRPTAQDLIDNSTVQKKMQLRDQKIREMEQKPQEQPQNPARKPTPKEEKLSAKVYAKSLTSSAIRHYIAEQERLEKHFEDCGEAPKMASLSLNLPTSSSESDSPDTDEEPEAAKKAEKAENDSTEKEQSSNAAAPPQAPEAPQDNTIVDTPQPVSEEDFIRARYQRIFEQERRLDEADLNNEVPVPSIKSAPMPRLRGRDRQLPPARKLDFNILDD